MGWLFWAEVVSAVGDRHVSTVTRESFDLHSLLDEWADAMQNSGTSLSF